MVKEKDNICAGSHFHPQGTEEEGTLLYRPSPHHDVRPRPRRDKCIQDQQQRSTSRPSWKAKIKSQQQLREQQLQLHGREESPRAGVAARAEVHVGPVCAGEIVLAAPPVRGLLAQFVISQAVKGVRVGCHFRVEEDGSRGDAQVGSSGDLEAGGEGQRSEGDAVEGSN